MHGQSLPWNEKDDQNSNNPYGWTKGVNECQFLSSNIKQSIGLRFLQFMVHMEDQIWHYFFYKKYNKWRKNKTI